VLNVRKARHVSLMLVASMVLVLLLMPAAGIHAEEEGPVWPVDSTLQATAAEYSVTLSWDPAISDVGIERYWIWIHTSRPGEYEGEDEWIEEDVVTVSGSVYGTTITKLKPNTDYIFDIEAKDFNQNYSSPLSVEVTTLAVEETEVHIPDPALEQLVRQQLELSDDTPITNIRMLDLEWLAYMEQEQLPGGPVRDLTGLEYALNLRELSLPNQAIYDLTPLHGLMLQHLNLSGNRLSNIRFFEDGQYTGIIGMHMEGYVDLQFNYLSVAEEQPDQTEDEKQLEQLRQLLESSDSYIMVNAENQLYDILNWEDSNQLQVSDLSGSELTLSWEQLPGAVEYVVYRNNEAIGRTGQTIYPVYDLSPMTRYTFKVEAVNQGEAETVSGPHIRVVTPAAAGGATIQLQWDEEAWQEASLGGLPVAAIVDSEVYAFEMSDDHGEVVFRDLPQGEVSFSLFYPALVGYGRDIIQTEALRITFTEEEPTGSGTIRLLPLRMPDAEPNGMYGIRDVLWYVEHWDVYRRDFDQNGLIDDNDKRVLLYLIPALVREPILVLQ